MERPQRPTAFQKPRFIELKPVKRPMQKPYWSLKTDEIGVCISDTKKGAYSALEARLKLAKLNYAELYNALEQRCGDVLRWPSSYSLQGDVYVSKNDKHEWHNADEVEMLEFLDWECENDK